MKKVLTLLCFLLTSTMVNAQFVKTDSYVMEQIATTTFGNATVYADSIHVWMEVKSSNELADNMRITLGKDLQQAYTSLQSLIEILKSRISKNEFITVTGPDQERYILKQSSINKSQFLVAKIQKEVDFNEVLTGAYLIVIGGLNTLGTQINSKITGKPTRLESNSPYAAWTEVN